MLSTFGWGKYADHNYGIDHFGASAKAADVINANHFDVDSVVSFVKGVK
jgi:transketolase